jgi:hypothetical protein
MRQNKVNIRFFKRLKQAKYIIKVALVIILKIEVTNMM